MIAELIFSGAFLYAIAAPCFALEAHLKQERRERRQERRAARRVPQERWHW